MLYDPKWEKISIPPRVQWIAHALRTAKGYQMRGGYRDGGGRCAIGVIRDAGLVPYVRPKEIAELFYWNDTLGLTFTQIADRAERQWVT